MPKCDDATGDAKLRGWKEISRHLRADERTARRWEQRGLPVHRLPGEGRSSVFADAAELDRWLRQQSSPLSNRSVAETQPPPSRKPLRWRTSVLVLAVLTLGAIPFALAWSSGSKENAIAPLRHVASDRVSELINEARLQNARATSDGFRSAINLTQEALARDPSNAEAYSELAFAYIRLPENDATVDRRMAYERAQDAAQRALDLNPGSWRAHSTMGFIEYGYHWNFVAGIRHFREVIRLNPARGPGHVQLGIALLNMGDTKDALRELELSSRLEAANPIYRAFYAQAQYVAGRREQAVSAWRQIVADQPNLVPVRTLIADDDLASGRYADALQQDAEIARMRHDRRESAAISAASRALGIGGAPAMFRIMLKDAEQGLATGRSGHFEVARLDGLLGRQNDALAELKEALKAREPDALSMRNDPLLSSVRSDARFERLAAAFGIVPPADHG